MSNSIKKSNFSAQTSLTDTDFFDFVRSGTNYKVSFSDLKAGIGITIDLASVGSPLGNPTMYQSTSTSYKFRAIESGSGVIAQISPKNGIEVGLNLTQDLTGAVIFDDVGATKPTVASLTSGQGISITKTNDAIEISNTVDPATGLSNRVVVTEAADFSGTLDSTKEYFLDGIIDMTGSGVEIEVPVGGINIAGYNFDLSKLICSDTNYTLFKSGASNSGDMLGRDYAIEITGAGSKVYDVTDATGFHAFEFARINYNNCTSLGTITGYRQGLEVGTGRFGGKPELTLAGTWVGGYFIDTSIVRSLTDGAYSLFKAGAAFSMASRFGSNQNIDLPASASFFDFAPANFTNPSTVQIQGALVSRSGAFDATDSNITPNMTEADLVASWSANTGMPNTFQGGSIGVTTETATVIAVAGTFYDVAATLWTAADLQHFSNPTAGQLKHLASSPRDFKIVANFALVSTSGDDLTLRVVKYDDSAAANVTVLDQTREVNNLVGGRDVAFFNININTTLDQNDYIFLQVANVAATNNVTAEADSYLVVEAR